MKHKFELLLLLLSWLIVAVIVNPIGDFPLNDDWAYGQIVKRFIETGVFDLGTWPGMTLFTHVMWGSLFCKIFGFSFTVLRFSNLLMAFVGTFTFFLLVKSLNKDPFWQKFSTATLLFNPFFFCLSFSYMTDVPFLTYLLLALLFYKKAFEQDRLMDWSLAIGFSILAILTRQLALLLPLSFGAALVFKKWGLRNLMIAAGMVILCFLVLKGYTSYLSATVGLPPPYGRPEAMLERLNITYFMGQVLDRGGVHLFYWSIFLFPLLWLFDLQATNKKRNRIAFGLSLLFVSFFYFQSWHLIPEGNLFYGDSLGPKLLPDVQKRISNVHTMPQYAWNILQAIVMISSVLLVRKVLLKSYDLISNWKERSSLTMWKVGLVFFLIGYSIFLILDVHNFDRYFLPGMPVLMLVLVSQKEYIARFKFQKIISIASLLLMAFFSVIATHDYLAWSGARWAILDKLVHQENVSPHRIDGGFEFNGWYNTGVRNPSKNEGKSWWFVDEDEYTVALQEFGCYEVLEKHPTHTFLNPVGDSLLLLKRPAFANRDTIFCGLEKVDKNSDRAFSLDGRYSFSVGGVLDMNSKRVFNGHGAVRLSPKRPYGLSIKIGDVEACEQFTITAWRKGNNRSAGIVVRAPNVDDFHSFERLFVDDSREGKWRRLRHEVDLPKDYPSDTVLIYLWNPVNDYIWFDDFQIIRRKLRD